MDIDNPALEACSRRLRAPELAFDEHRFGCKVDIGEREYSHADSAPEVDENLMACWVGKGGAAASFRNRPGGSWNELRMCRSVYSLRSL